MKEGTIEELLGAEYAAGAAFEKQAASDAQTHKDTIAKLEAIAERIRALKHPEIPRVRVEYDSEPDEADATKKARKSPFIVVASWVKKFPPNTSLKEVADSQRKAFEELMTNLKLNNDEKQLVIELRESTERKLLTFSQRTLNELQSVTQRRKGAGRLAGARDRRRTKAPPALLRPGRLRPATSWFLVEHSSGSS